MERLIYFVVINEVLLDFLIVGRVEKLLKAIHLENIVPFLQAVYGLVIYIDAFLEQETSREHELLWELIEELFEFGQVPQFSHSVHDEYDFLLLMRVSVSQILEVFLHFLLILNVIYLVILYVLFFHFFLALQLLDLHFFRLLQFFGIKMFLLVF